VWNADRTVLYDMQFTSPVIVRAEGSDRPWPYGPSFAHPYYSDIDFKKYRAFYPPGQISPVITVDHSRTMYRPGDTVRIKGSVKNTEGADWKDVTLKADVADTEGARVSRGALASWPSIKSGSVQEFDVEAWKLHEGMKPGRFQFILQLLTPEGRNLATTTFEFAINALPASLMVFNAHPDDEVAYGGLIRAAAEAGIPVRVVTFTSGDVGSCERYYAKPCGPNEAREFGLLRMEESADALAHLGVPRDHLTFLGLPDGGSGAIWFQHVSAVKPFRSIYLASDHAPYENVFKPNLAYARDSVIEVTKQLIADFRPEMIVTTHPDERHVDHRTANWFVVKACQDLVREQRIDAKTQIFADVSYGAGGYKPAPYRYETYLVYLSGEAAALKQEMDWLYQSQHGNYAEGSRKTYSELPRFEEHLRILDWQSFGGWNE
jgi:LmbE family N-acetylglucosaminyl deacetylase